MFGVSRIFDFGLYHLADVLHSPFPYFFLVPIMTYTELFILASKSSWLFPRSPRPLSIAEPSNNPLHTVKHLPSPVDLAIKLSSWKDLEYLCAFPS